MGYEPNQCIVVEDSTSGIRAARAAGMEVLGFLGGGHAKAQWYRDEIFRFKIPTVETEMEVLQWIESKMT